MQLLTKPSNNIQAKQNIWGNTTFTLWGFIGGGGRAYCLKDHKPLSYTRWILPPYNETAF